MSATSQLRKRRPWYADYSQLASHVEQLRKDFRVRCQSLGVSATRALNDFRRDLISRSVHESNWQEGVHLSEGHTREMAEIAFNEEAAKPFTTGPSLDLQGLAVAHLQEVQGMKRRGRTAEEIAALNLARAHIAVGYIAYELASRQAASLAHALERASQLVRQVEPPPQVVDALRRGGEVLSRLKASDAPLLAPFASESIRTEGQLLTAWLKSAHPDDLLSPMKVAYVHFLHRVTMSGILSSKELGRFRRTAVHVGNRDLYFPPPSAIAAMMNEFGSAFPTILPPTVTYDPILKAAEASYRFVRIHPYADGNGRVSRLLMNLVLWGHHPPVYLKADAKGRHRYAQALRRADRGNIQPLSALIAMSLVEIYEKLLGALGAKRSKN